MRFRFLVSVAAALCILASVEASADLAGVRVASGSGGLRGHEHDQRTSDAAAATLAEGDTLAAGAIGSIVLNPAAAEDDGGGGSREGLERWDAPGEGRRPTRALLQDPFILQPPVPINWWIFGDAPLVEWNIDDPVVSYWLSFVSNWASVEAISFNLFGDLPLAGVGLPKLDIFGGRGLNPLDFEGIEAGAVLVQLAAWIEFSFLDFGANWPFVRVDLFDSFGFEELGLPENFSNHYTVPYDSEGVINLTVVEDSFINWIRTRGWLDLFNTPPFGIYGVNFSSI
mmetsp:Transcript_9470/g.23571  ORF Transcript_9470/g.23571 Transcript_9470/m.23571 type:complete len:284 (+) Transcript_9470:80-931(+)